jgi:chromosome segregation ATPase
MKSIFVLVSALPALAVGWVGAGGLASLAASPQAPPVLPSPFSFADEAAWHVAWKAEQGRRKDASDAISENREQLEEEKKRWERATTNLERLKTKLDQIKGSMENYANAQTKFEFISKSGDLIGEAESLQTQIAENRTLVEDELQILHALNSEIEDKTFQGKTDLVKKKETQLEEFIESKTNAIEELKKKIEEWEGKANQALNPLQSDDPQ